jgi:aminoglycoside 3-N-acetyltransferase
MAYSFADMVDAYGRLGLERGSIVYVISSLWHVPDYADGPSDELAPAHYRALREVVGDGGTIVVPTSTLKLCNTEIPFDPGATPSQDRGIFAEFVRTLPDARRSFHPFASYAAVGPMSDAIVADVSRHGYGPETPEARFVEAGARVVNIGLPANICTAVHHAEQVMGVPYRFTKEFIHPVVRDGDIRPEPFYLFVQYPGIGVERDYNRTLFSALAERIEIREAPLGRGRVCSYGLDDFHRQTTRLMADDIYIWCKTPPQERPYQS